MPVTQYGKLVLLAYAVIGIPVFVLYLRNMGQVRHVNIDTQSVIYLGVRPGVQVGVQHAAVVVGTAGGARDR